MKPVSACLYIFLLDWGVLVKEASQGIKVLMTEKTGSFVWASNEIRFQDICSKIEDIYLVNFMDGNTLKLTGLSDGKNKAKHDCLVVKWPRRRNPSHIEHPKYDPEYV